MSTTLLQDLVHRLESEDPLALGTMVRWQARCLEQRRFSTIHVLEPVQGCDLVRSRVGAEALVLKLYRNALPERRQKEFDDLVRVFAALSPEAGVVRPVACWPEHGAVLTVRARGVPFAPVLRGACRRGAGAPLLAHAAALCTAAGGWLRHFQAEGVDAMSGRRAEHLGSQPAFLEYLDERLRLLRAARPGIEPELRARLLAHAAAALQALPPGSLEDVTWSHSDFGPHNLLADGERLTVLDVDLEPQHPYFDAAYFVESLAHLHGPLLDATRVRRLERAFLAGYGAHLDEPLFTLFRLRHLICSYVSEGRRSGLARLRLWPGLLGMRTRLRRFPQTLPLRSQSRAA